MLKERLKQWKFKKNFKKAEHEAAAMKAKQCADQGINPLVDTAADGRPFHGIAFIVISARIPNT